MTALMESPLADLIYRGKVRDTQKYARDFGNDHFLKSAHFGNHAKPLEI